MTYDINNKRDPIESNTIELKYFSQLSDKLFQL